MPSVPPTAPWCQAADPVTRLPQFTMPPLACDCHAHICGPIERYPYAPERIYTPPDALLADYRRMLGILGVERAVLVQPSVYGSDNTVLVEALREAGASMRGVAVVDGSITDAELRRLDSVGVRGIRVNVVDRREGRNVVPVDELLPLVERIADLGWHLELLAQVDAIADLAALLAAIPIDVVFGHLGYMHAGPGDTNHPGFQAMLRAMDAGRCWVKLTGPYRISIMPTPWPDVWPMARALVKHAPERLLWGTDWPHVMVKGIVPNDGDIADRVPEWIPDAETRRRVLVENPARLYGWGLAGSGT